MERNGLMLFAPHATQEFAARVAERLGVVPSPHEERDFEDGEHKIRPLANVRGRDVFAIQSLYADERQSVNDKLCRFLFFLGALRDASAARVTALVPYLGYARRDAKTQTRDPVTTRYVAALFEAVDVDRVVTLEVHNLAAFQNAFRCHTDHLDTTALFARHFADLLRDEANVIVVSPDAGGVKRAERLRRALGHLWRRELPMAIAEKARGQGVLRAGRLIGDVRGATVIVIDDIVSTGGTLAHTARACRAGGARRVFAAATHGLFVGDAARIVASDDIEKLVVTDTVPAFRLAPELVQNKLTIVSVAPLFAEAIRYIHDNGSIVELLEV